MKKMPRAKCRTALATLWFIGGGVLFLILALQTINQHYEQYGVTAQDAWAWFLPTIMPTLSLMIAVFAADATNPQQENTDVSTFTFFLSFVISFVYLTLVALTILLQPIVNTPILELMKKSNLYLSPIQGAVAATVGIFFVRSKGSSSPTRSHPSPVLP